MRMRLQSSVEERISGFVDTYRALCDASGERILSRRAMTMEAVHPFASALTIIEVIGAEEWRIRLSGTDICERSGVNTTGRNALASFSKAERAVRTRLVNRLFENPCGIRALLSEIYSNGAHALLDTISLPLMGNEGQRMFVNFALIVKDIDHPYRERPVARRTRLLAHRPVDLGFGLPGQRGLRLSA